MIDREETQKIEISQQLSQPEAPGVCKVVGDAFTFYSASDTNVGCVRQINEDAYLELPEKRIWAVADGMGGHDAGDVASRIVMDNVSKSEYTSLLSRHVDNVEDAILAANSTLYKMGQQSGKVAGSTVLAVLLHTNHCLLMWAGDSRAYLVRNGQGMAVTRDHSYVEELVERGELNRQEAELHPKANIITRAVGASPTLFLDMDILEIQNDDMFLLCSDGLFKEVREQEIYAALNALSPDRAVHELMKLAIERGARDNVTLIAIKVQANG